jgi:spore maturation protein CgeB
MINQDQELEELQSRMKQDWDERVRHDYRYWMSDGIKSDEAMWETGCRDFEILTNGIPESFLNKSKILDLGCGVGRLLRFAAHECREAIGVDVSEEAVRTAHRLLSDLSNVQIILGDGSRLNEISDNEIDIAISFAALGSMPAVVLASYLHELSRVLRKNGILRIQVYLGKEQEISEEDTLALRSYDQERFFASLRSAGFKVNYKQEVILPFEVSDYENGIIAYVVGAEKVSAPTRKVEDTHSILVSSKEIRSGDEWSGSRTAYLVALARAQQQIDENLLEEAKESIRLARASYKGGGEEAEELLKKISESGRQQNKTPIDSAEEKKTILKPEVNASGDISVESCSDGYIVRLDGICMSHSTAPLKAASNWATRSLNSLKRKDADILMVGLGDGHFADMLSNESGKKIFVFESDRRILDTVQWYSKDKIEVIDTIDKLESSLRAGIIKENPELVILPAAPFYLESEIEEVKRRVNSRYLLTTLSPNVAVVGPLYGGSLPIAEYVYRACDKIGLKSNFINLSSYYSSFTSFEKFLKKPESKSVLENQYVELLSELVFQTVSEKKIDILISVAQAPLSSKVLEKCKEKGIITVHWFMEDINRFSTWKQIAKYYDYFFVIQKDYAIDRIKDAGGKRVHYLPLACDPDIHVSMDLSPEERAEFGSQISFVGAGYNNRRYVFSKYAMDDFKIWGTEWPDVLPFSQMVQRKGARISVNEYIKIFNASEINLNLHSSHEKNGIDPTGDFVNPRTFELASCKAFQLVDKRSLLSEHFAADEIATFETESELKDRIQFFLESPEERTSYIEKSYRRVIEEHTYEHRVRTMLEFVYSDFGASLAGKTSNDSWSRTLEAARPYDELYKLFEDARERGEDPTLEGVTRPLLNSTGVLSDTEKKLMFLHHMRGQISQINKLRNNEEA